MPEKTDQVQFSLAHCVGHQAHYNFHRFLGYLIFQFTTVFSKIPLTKYYYDSLFYIQIGTLAIVGYQNRFL